jgi:hypothetical protein
MNSISFGLSIGLLQILVVAVVVIAVIWIARLIS